MRPAFRPATWRQAVITYTAVLPVSLVLNFAPIPITEHWPRLAVVVFNATILVATLNWALLPALHCLTRGWAAPRPTPRPEATAPPHTRKVIESETGQRRSNTRGSSSTVHGCSEPVPLSIYNLPNLPLDNPY